MAVTFAPRRGAERAGAEFAKFPLFSITNAGALSIFGELRRGAIRASPRHIAQPHFTRRDRDVRFGLYNGNAVSHSRIAALSMTLQSLRERMLRRYAYDREEVLERVMKRMSRSRSPFTFSILWTDAIYGWGNERWSAEARYLSEVVRAAEKTKGPILECGSGLTTLLMGMVAARRGNQVHSLEHNADWHARVSEALEHFGLTNVVTVHLSPLREFGSFDWYDAPLADMPDDFSLVICDGPPGVTRGGRSGMLPIMHDKLGKSFSILLDDANRPAENQLVQEWTRELHVPPRLNTKGRGFAQIQVRG